MRHPELQFWQTGRGIDVTLAGCGSGLLEGQESPCGGTRFERADGKSAGRGPECVAGRRYISPHLSIGFTPCDCHRLLRPPWP